MEFAIQKTVSAEEVKVIRQRLHLKQKELADLMNVSVKTVEHWESSQGTVKGAAAALEWQKKKPVLVSKAKKPGRKGQAMAFVTVNGSEIFGL